MPVRIALLTEGGYPFARGESGVWCDRLLRHLSGHDFEVCALSRSRQQDAGERRPLPPNVVRLRTAPLWGPPPDAAASGWLSRRLARRYAEAFAELTAALCTPDLPVPAADGAADAGPGGEHPGAAGAGDTLADRFAGGLYALADLAADHGGLSAWLRSARAVAVLEAACRTPGAPRAVHSARVADLLAVTERLERVLRPLSLDWYGMDGDRPGADAGLAAAQLCHAVGGGPAALPGLLTRHFYGTPLLITEYGVRLREHYLLSAAHAVAPSAPGAPVRALLASFQRQLAREAYTAADLITPGNTHARRWQERCGADRERLRTVYPGMDARPFHGVGEAGSRPADGAARLPGGTAGDVPAAVDGHARSVGEAPPALVWVGRIEPARDLVGLLHAFAEVRRAEPRARLRIVAAAQRGRPDPGYLAHCRALAAQLFPDEAAGAYAVGRNPVVFDEVGSPETPTVAAAYAAGAVAVLSSVVEGFPVSLVEAMFCARPTVSTDVGAVPEVIGGTGLVVPPRNPRAFADACLALLRDPERRVRLGAAARARALELFTVEQNVAAFRSIYLELISASPARWSDHDQPAADVPFARPAEAHLPVRLPDAPPRWAADRPSADRTAAGPARPGSAGRAGVSGAKPVAAGGER